MISNLQDSRCIFFINLLYMGAVLARWYIISKTNICNYSYVSWLLIWLFPCSYQWPVMLTWNAISRRTKGFSGEDLQALLSDTQLKAIHLLLDREDGSGTGNMPIITGAPLESMASKAKCLNHQFQKLRSKGCTTFTASFSIQSGLSLNRYISHSLSLV